MSYITQIQSQAASLMKSPSPQAKLVLKSLSKEQRDYLTKVILASEDDGAYFSKPKIDAISDILTGKVVVQKSNTWSKRASRKIQNVLGFRKGVDEVYRALEKQKPIIQIKEAIREEVKKLASKKNQGIFSQQIQKAIPCNYENPDYFANIYRDFGLKVGASEKAILKAYQKKVHKLEKKGNVKAERAKIDHHFKKLVCLKEVEARLSLKSNYTLAEVEELLDQVALHTGEKERIYAKVLIAYDFKPEKKVREKKIDTDGADQALSREE